MLELTDGIPGGQYQVHGCWDEAIVGYMDAWVAGSVAITPIKGGRWDCDEAPSIFDSDLMEVVEYDCGSLIVDDWDALDAALQPN